MKYYDLQQCAGAVAGVDDEDHGFGQNNDEAVVVVYTKKKMGYFYLWEILLAPQTGPPLLCLKL